MIKGRDSFVFEISLSVLNHLGRNLYRNFITVIGEAVSNSWDADADNVWIYIDKDSGDFIIKDDGDGMNDIDFQGKFLKIGYSKRKKGKNISRKKRPFIGAKGIGKLALLSCAEKITIISKTLKTDYVGGTIDNSGLNDAITEDLKPEEYPLEDFNSDLFQDYIKDHKKGTIIYFQQMRDGIRNTTPHLKKLIALHFRFSLIDKSFNIFVNDELVTLDDLKDLSGATEFLWNINKLQDPYLKTFSNIGAEPINIKTDLSITGFIATVGKPRDLKIAGTEEKTGIDLFVNGRLRETDILKHMPDFSTRFVASYLYGKIHFDELDTGLKNDNFTTSREGIVPGQSKYGNLLRVFKEELLEKIADEWDALRLDRGKDGEDENPRKTPEERRALGLFNLSSKDYTDSGGPPTKDLIKGLRSDAEFNIPAYVHCFLSENLVRKYINDKGIQLTTVAKAQIKEWKDREIENKKQANINIDIIKNSEDLSYLGMDTLTYLADNTGDTNSIRKDAKEYKPLRNAVMHTAILTDTAKQKLTTVYGNIKARVQKLLSEK